MMARLQGKASPFGTDVPTNIERPDVGSVGIRPGPTPRRFRRSLPLNPRNLRAALNASITRGKPRMVRFIKGQSRKGQADVTLAELELALGTGVFDERWLQRWRQRYAARINNDLAPLWNQTLNNGSQSVISGISGALTSKVDFALLGTRYDTWVKTRSATFVRDITETQRSALRKVIRRYAVTEPTSSRNMAKLIRPMVGLTTNQATSVQRLQEKLMKDGVPQTDIRRITARKTVDLISRRADVIARTELAFAHNFGAFEAVRLAQSQGGFGPGVTPKKRWFTAQDERVCPFCGPLNGQLIGMDETFPGATPVMPNTFAPPAHPLCRLRDALRPGGRRTGTGHHAAAAAASSAAASYHAAAAAVGDPSAIGSESCADSSSAVIDSRPVDGQAR